MTTETAETYAEIGIPINPFPGLRPFEFDESHLFFGRDGQSESLIEKLGRTHFLAVVGTSGSGKSSLVRAGLLSALLGGFMTSAGSNWRIAIMRPGNDPVGNLARVLNAPDVFGSEDSENAALQTALAEATLRRGSRGLVDAFRQAVVPENENLLVVADQFEEIFRFARVAESEQYQNEAAAFVKLLLEASRQREIPIYVVLTMRSDYLGDCSQFWELPEAINESQYLIPRLTRDQLREAISGPVAVGGGQITPRLVNRLLNDVGDNQDQLPVLQHLLMRVWDESKEKQLEIEVKEVNATTRTPHSEVHNGESLDLCCYEAVGGMAEALSRHADEAFNDLPDERSREVAEKLFKGLTEKGSDNREIRRPVTLGEICAMAGARAAEVITVIETFRQPGRSFLMPPAGVALDEDSLIDISHESLIRGWSRLKQWTEEEAQSARLYKRLADTAGLHEANLEGLLKDPALQVALDWRDKNKPNEAWAHRYHPGLATANSFLDQSVAAREAELLERRRQQKRDTSYKRSKILVACLVVASGLLLSMFVYAYGKNVKANARLAEAVKQQTIADKERREAEILGRDAQMRSQAAYSQANAATKQANDAKLAMDAALAKSHKAELQMRAALGQRDKALKLQQEAEDERGKAQSAQVVAEEAESEAKAAKEEAEREKDKAVGSLEKAEKAEAEAIAQKMIAVESARTARHLLYVAQMNLAQQAYRENNLEKMKYLLDAFLPTHNDPKRDDPRDFTWYYLWRILHKEQPTVKLTDSTVLSAVFSPDGKTLVTASGDTTVRLWDVRKGLELATLKGHSAPVYSVALSPDGKILATGSGDNTVKLWDLRTHQELATLLGHTSYVTSVVFAPDARTLATGSNDRTVRLWDITSRQVLATLKLQGSVGSLAIAPDGQTLVTGSNDGEVSLWDIASMSPLRSIEGHKSPVISVVFSPNGRTFASGSLDGIVKRWNVSTGEELAILKGFTGSVYSVAFSSDGKTLAYGSDNGMVKLWDIQTGQEIASLKEDTDDVHLLAFSPDNKTLVSAGKSNAMRLWFAY
jgi:WD40 repeat protein